METMDITYIAEIGSNHNGDLRLALKMVDAALDAKADYIKFQIYHIDKFVDRNSIYYDDFISESLSFEAFEELKDHIEERGGKFLATPFDEDSMSFLHRMGVDTVKIASGDMNNTQLLQQAVGLGKKLIISVGGASLDEIDCMVDFLEKRKAVFSILHCVINYPAGFDELNLRFIRTLKKRYHHAIGFSDHSPGIEASLAAIALGAEIIEKHFTIDRSLPGGDNEMSILPEEFARLKKEGTHIKAALGSEEKSLSDGEEKIKKLIRRKFAARRDISQGSAIEDADLLLLRVNDYNEGYDADRYAFLIGKRLRRHIPQGKIITQSDING
jgi:N,N'-diacetyllegionaminate synthase